MSEAKVTPREVLVALELSVNKQSDRDQARKFAEYAAAAQLNALAEAGLIVVPADLVNEMQELLHWAAYYTTAQEVDSVRRARMQNVRRKMRDYRRALDV